MSLDGYIAGPDDGAEHPLGVGGERLFAWMSAGPEENRVERRLAPPDASLPVVEAWTTDCGALVSGRRTFDIAGGWADGHPIDVPIFVVTHEAPDRGRVEPAGAVRDRRSRAGASSWRSRRRATSTSRWAPPARRSSCCGPGSSTRSRSAWSRACSGAASGCFDHLGADPIDLEQVRVTPSEGVTHLRYRVVR